MDANRFRLICATMPALLLLAAAIVLALGCAAPAVETRELPPRAIVCERASARHLDDDSGDMGRTVWAPERCLPRPTDSL